MYTRINFDYPINTSAQVGDYIYISSISTLTQHQNSSNIGLQGVTSTPEFAEKILEIGVDFVVIDKDPSAAPVITQGDYISFAKRIEANETSLKGYYADITLKNSSHDKVELFAISSDISLSSK